MDVGRAFPVQGSGIIIGGAADLKCLENRIAALEAQIQRLPEDVAKHIIGVLHQRETLCAEQACRAVLPRRSTPNSPDSYAE